MVVDHHVIPLELCELRWSKSRTLEDRVGKAALMALGRDAWEKSVQAVVAIIEERVTDERAPLADRYFGYFSDAHSELGRAYYMDIRMAW